MHAGQLAVVKSRARFRVLACGRRWGKSMLATLLCIQAAAASPNRCVWFVSPTYPMADIHWRALLKAMPRQALRETNLADRRVVLVNGSEIVFKSGDNADRLRGAGLDFLVMDEAAFFADSSYTWDEVLRPALTDRKGKALVVGTPRGHDWFAGMWQRGQTGAPDFASWQFPTASNPYIDPEEVEEARQQLPDSAFRQEYLAEFLADGAVVRYVDAAVYAECPPLVGPVVVGADWGKRADFSVFIAYDTGAQAVREVVRINSIEYPVQIEALAALVKRQKAQVLLAETNGVGDPLCDLAQQAGLPVRRFETTQASKARIVGRLIGEFDHHRLKIPADKALVGELKAFTMSVTRSGGVTYAAPLGMHDDCVMALAFALEGATLVGQRWSVI
jgi:hypothetical protein